MEVSLASRGIAIESQRGLGEGTWRYPPAMRLTQRLRQLDERVLPPIGSEAPRWPLWFLGFALAIVLGTRAFEAGIHRQPDLFFAPLSVGGLAFCLGSLIQTRRR